MYDHNQGLASRLSAARERTGLSQSEAAKRAGMKLPNWNQYEHGRNASLELLHRMALAIGADPHDIDERLCPGPDGRTLTLVFEGEDPEMPLLVPETEGDQALFGQVLDELVGTITPKTVAGLVQAAGLARVKLVIRTDLAPRVVAPEVPAPKPTTPKKGGKRPG